MERWTRAGMLGGGLREYRREIAAARAPTGGRQAFRTAARSGPDTPALSIAARFRENRRPNSAVSPR